MTQCIRCKKQFEQALNPMAHFFSICKECHNEQPETLYDQTLYHIDVLEKLT